MLNFNVESFNPKTECGISFVYHISTNKVDRMKEYMGYLIHSYV